MATVTEHLGFGITAATSFEHPYSFARRMSTLDHLTKGRVGWNIVTGYLESAARNTGSTPSPRTTTATTSPTSTSRCSTSCGRARGRTTRSAPTRGRAEYTDPAKVHPIEHEGKHFRVPGIHLSEPSPQRTPVLYQAGASNRGRQFAAENAEVIFIGAPTKEVLREAVADIRGPRGGRRARPVRREDRQRPRRGHRGDRGRRQARYEDFRRYIDPEGALALWSGWLGTDLSRFDLDDPVGRHRQRIPQVVGADVRPGPVDGARFHRRARDRRRRRLQRRLAARRSPTICRSGSRRPTSTGSTSPTSSRPARSSTSSTTSSPNSSGAERTRPPTPKARCATSCSAVAHVCPRHTERRATAALPRRSFDDCHRDARAGRRQACRRWFRWAGPPDRGHRRGCPGTRAHGRTAFRGN